MESGFQKGQKVQTPDGEGLISAITGDEIIVKLSTGDEKKYGSDELQDDADQG